MDNFLHTVTRLDEANNLTDLLALAQDPTHTPEQLMAAMEHLLIAGQIRPAYILAMILANRNQLNSVIALTLCLGGLQFDNREEENRGLTHLRQQTNTLPLSSEQQASLYSRVIRPVLQPLLENALSHAHHERLLRLITILYTAIPEWRASYESQMYATPTGETLLHFILHHEHRYIDKWRHYLEIYERHFARFRGQEIALIEFGVSHGGSLQMWKHYFGPRATIYGVDIDPRCAVVNEENITVFQGNQDDRSSLQALCQALPPFDIIIDDGGHTMSQQINTFEELFFHLKDGGIYLAEDLHTSYMKSHGGIYRDPGNFIEYTKNLIDQLNARYSEDPRLTVNEHTRSIFALHYYDSVLVIEKRSVGAAIQVQRGTPSFNNFS